MATARNYSANQSSYELGFQRAERHRRLPMTRRRLLSASDRHLRDAAAGSAPNYLDGAQYREWVRGYVAGWNADPERNGRLPNYFWNNPVLVGARRARSADELHAIARRRSVRLVPLNGDEWLTSRPMSELDARRLRADLARAGYDTRVEEDPEDASLRWVFVLSDGRR